MHSGLWIIAIAPFIISFAQKWSLKRAIHETFWFNVFYLGALAAIYIAEAAGSDFISTSPTGPGGGIAIGVGFIGFAIGRNLWNRKQRKIRAERAAAEAERRRRVAAGEIKPGRESLIVDAFRFAGNMQKQRKNAKR